MIGQRSNLLLLSAILSVSTAILPHASADDSLVSHEQTSNQGDRGGTTSSTTFHFRTLKSISRLPNWAHTPPRAELNRNLYHNEFAQVLRLEHTSPPVNDPSELANEIFSDDDSDDDELPSQHLADLNHQPVPTKWLMLGYSRVVDIPTSPTSDTTASVCQGHNWSNSPQTTPSDSTAKTTVTPCDTHRTSQTDWMQKIPAQVFGPLTLFLIFVIITHSVIYLWRGSCRIRAKMAGRSELAVEDHEKQFHAGTADIESRAESPRPIKSHSF